MFIFQFSRHLIVLIFFLISLTMLTACSNSDSWNNPYAASDGDKNILYTSFDERPKHLDPAVSYSANEYDFIAQIYEPPLQYHYLARPYQLIPLSAKQVPKPKYFDKDDKPLPDNAPIEKIAYTIYEVEIQPGIKYQPHPAFARNDKGEYRYLDLSAKEMEGKHILADFEFTGTREVTAEDYVYQIKRLAHPKLHSPILGLMSDYIDGLGDYAKRLQQILSSQEKKSDAKILDLRSYNFIGAQVTGRYAYQIRIRGKYPQFIYWLAMPFFSPMPFEADLFYGQAGMETNNISLDWYPVGSGPYMLQENNPNLRMSLLRNPNFHGERYPSHGELADSESGLLLDAGKPLPFIDKVVFSREKEFIPSWNKFLQGYYDSSGINSDSFDQAVVFNSGGDAELTPSMKEKGIRLQTGIGTSISYIGFNMNDDVVGGSSDRAKKLRQAISIVFDFEEMISIFSNGRGIPAQGPIPPGIFGFVEGEAGINPVVYDWIDGKAMRKSVDEAKQLLAQAGYPNGRDAKSGKPLVLYFDAVGSGPDFKSLMDWYRKQFEKLSIQLEIRNTDYNRFQDKMSKGNAQIFRWGWNADYPDPENFMFLLYGPNAKVEHGGENASNYKNKTFDALFDVMKNMDNGPERQIVLDKMLKIIRDDSPWIFGYHPKSYGLYHQWMQNTKTNFIANNTLKYKKIDPLLRAKLRQEWNHPVTWPLWTLLVVFIGIVVPGIVVYRKRSRTVGVLA